MGRACIALLMVVAALGGSAAAQTITPEPPGPYVIDLHGAMTKIPQAAVEYPGVPPGTTVPARSFGAEVGAHVYPVALGHVRVGFGVAFTEVRGTASTPVSPLAGSSSSDTSSLPPSSSPVAFPSIRTRERIIAPQVSLNFGTHDGWSYVSVGYGSVREITEAVYTSGPTTTASTTHGAAEFGGGARWFLNTHLGVGFDLRFYRIPSATLFGVGAGISVR
jgi:hypothetical protein